MMIVWGEKNIQQIISINIPLWLVTFFSFYIWEFHFAFKVTARIMRKCSSNFFFLILPQVPHLFLLL